MVARPATWTSTADGVCPGTARTAHGCANLLDWFRTLKPRVTVTVTNEEVAAKTNVYKQAPVFFGVW